MKYLIVFLGFFTAIQVGKAQDLLPSQVPSAVINAFNRTFPDARDVEWEKESVFYQVEFEINRLDNDVWMDETGKIVRHKQEIEPGSLPAPVVEAIKKKHGNARIDDVDKITEGSQVRYKIEVDTNMGDVEFYMDETGRVLNRRK